MAKITIPAVEVKSTKADIFLADAEYCFFGTEAQKTELEVITAAHDWMRDALRHHIVAKCAKREEERTRQKNYFVDDAA